MSFVYGQRNGARSRDGARLVCSGLTPKRRMLRDTLGEQFSRSQGGVSVRAAEAYTVLCGFPYGQSADTAVAVELFGVRLLGMAGSHSEVISPGPAVICTRRLRLILTVRSIAHSPLIWSIWLNPSLTSVAQTALTRFPQFPQRGY